MALPDESMAGAAARPPLGEQPLGEQPLGELSLNGMPLDDGVLGIMQVETAAVVEMLTALLRCNTAPYLLGARESSRAACFCASFDVART